MNLFIGNVAYEATDEDIARFFAENEIEVKSAKVILDRETGPASGFGFAEVSADDAERALNLDGSDLMGRQLRISEARERVRR